MKRLETAFVACFFAFVLVFSAGTASAAFSMDFEEGPHDVVVPCDGSATMEINGTVESTGAARLEFYPKSIYASSIQVTPSVMTFPVGGGTQNLTIVATYTGPLPMDGAESLEDTIDILVLSQPGSTTSAVIVARVTLYQEPCSPEEEGEEEDPDEPDEPEDPDEPVQPGDPEEPSQPDAPDEEQEAEEEQEQSGQENPGSIPEPGLMTAVAVMAAAFLFCRRFRP